MEGLKVMLLNKYLHRKVHITCFIQAITNIDSDLSLVCVRLQFKAVLSFAYLISTHVAMNYLPCLIVLVWKMMTRFLWVQIITIPVVLMFCYCLVARVGLRFRAETIRSLLTLTIRRYKQNK
jgi:hypothetical protein